MENKFICEKCLKLADAFMMCECGGITRHICERIDCNNVGRHSVYALGYIANVCDEHYAEASPEDKTDAIRFRYAEG